MPAAPTPKTEPLAELLEEARDRSLVAYARTCGYAPTKLEAEYHKGAADAYDKILDLIAPDEELEDLDELASLGDAIDAPTSEEGHE